MLARLRPACLRLIILSLLGAMLGLPVRATMAAGSGNLILNGDAETGTCTRDWKAVTTVPGWRVVKGNPSIVCYDIASFSTPGGASGGKAFLSDGPYGDASMDQTIDLSPAASAIDGGAVQFTLSGWLGGWGAYTGEAQVNLNYLDASGRVLSSTVLSGDTPSARGLSNRFLAANTSGYVPIGTRSATVIVNFVNTAGSYNVGYADQLSLVLNTPVAPGILKPPVSQVPAFDHVFLIMMENTDYTQVIGNTTYAPFINTLATQGQLLTNASGTYHPSDENYLSIAGGDTFVQGAIYFPNIKIDAPHLGDRIEAVGKTWKAYEQGMGTPCNLTTSFDKSYMPDDAPFINFTNISGNLTRCKAHLFDTTQLTTDLASAGTTPHFSWIAADDYYDGEASGNGSNGSVQIQDQWLKQTLQPIFNSPAWTQQRSLLILTWDESSSSNGNHVATILLGSRGTVLNGRTNSSYNHYSIARTIEQALQLQALTYNDGWAPAINEAFVAGPTVSLSLSANTIRAGDTLNIAYSVPVASVNSRNWIGIYRTGDVPGTASSQLWAYTANASGMISFGTASLAPGQYQIAMFANDGYGALTPMMPLQVNP